MYSFKKHKKKFASRAGIRGVCHDIIGTDGLGYAPPISKEDDISPGIFNSCSSKLAKLISNLILFKLKRDRNGTLEDLTWLGKDFS